MEVISEPVETVFERSDVVIAASGTVTLQAALHGTPMVIIYRVSPISYWLGRALDLGYPRASVENSASLTDLRLRTRYPEPFEGGESGSSHNRRRGA